MAGLVSLTVAYLLSQFYRSFMAVLTPVLTSELGATKGDLSLASGLFFLSFALAQFGIGVALDRIGPRRTSASLLALGGGGGAMLFASSTQPWMITVAMFLLGIGCAPVLMASLFIFARTYSPARFSVLTSWLIGLGTAGNVIGAAPLAQAADAFGWRSVMFGLGFFTLATALAVYLMVRDPERPEGQADANSGLRGYIDLLKLRVLWPIIPITMINYAPALGIRGLWAGPYLTDVYGADSLTIGSVTFFMALGMVAGAFIYGPLDQLFNTRKWAGVVGNSIGVAVLILLALWTVNDLATTKICLVLIGVTGGAYGLLMAHARAFFPPELVGRGVTLMNFFAIGGIGLLQFGSGALVTTKADPTDPVAGFSALFMFYAVLLGLSIVIYLFSKDAPPAKSI